MFPERERRDIVLVNVISCFLRKHEQTHTHTTHTNTINILKYDNLEGN